MKVSTKGIYALEALMDMCLNDAKRPMTVKEISKRCQMSEKYLERIIGSLKRAGILESSRGKFGGYSFTKPADVLTVEEILKAVEGNIVPVSCVQGESDCGIDCDTCATRMFWCGMHQEISQILSGVTLSQLVECSVKIN